MGIFSRKPKEKKPNCYKVQLIIEPNLTSGHIAIDKEYEEILQLYKDHYVVFKNEKYTIVINTK